MDSLSAGATQSWFAVKVAIALSPILAFWVAGFIDWLMRRALWPRLEVAPRPEPVQEGRADVSR